MLAHEDAVGAFAAETGGERLGDGEGIEGRVGADEHGAVGAHGQAGAESFDAVVGADGDDDDFEGGGGFLEAEGLLEGDGVEGIDGELDAVGLNAGAVGFDANAGVGVGDAFEGDENFHGVLFN